MLSAIASQRNGLASWLAALFRIKPMPLREGPAPFPDWHFDIKHDGLRRADLCESPSLLSGKERTKLKARPCRSVISLRRLHVNGSSEETIPLPSFRPLYSLLRLSHGTGGQVKIVNGF